MEEKKTIKATGKKVAIIGSGPAGLTAADQLNKVGHSVTVFEREDRIGGLLVYGIPNMKLSKSLLSRRIGLLESQGIVFKTKTNIGKDISAKELKESYDSILIATGSTIPRDLDVKGRDSENIHFAMDFLTQNTKSLLNSSLSDGNYIDAKDKNVIVIGGGDTGTDCIATAIRHGCKNMVNMEIMNKPPKKRGADNPWPLWPNILRIDYGHEESKKRFGSDPRRFSLLSKEFLSKDGAVSGLTTVEIEWAQGKDGKMQMKEIANSEKTWEADLVLLALGFIGPEQEVLNDFGLSTNTMGNIDSAYGEFSTDIDGVFAAGDARRGQSLVVWAMNEGRGAALEIDRYLEGSSRLSAPSLKLGSLKT